MNIVVISYFGLTEKKIEDDKKVNYCKRIYP